MDERHNSLTQEWHSKNAKPFSEYRKSSHYKAWWRCHVCAHEWQATISNRVGNGSNCPECRKRRSRGSNNKAWLGYEDISGKQWQSIVRRATSRRVPLEVTIEDIWQVFLQQGRCCALTGKPLTMYGKRNGKLAGNASLDRIDPSKGYVPGNVQWIDKMIQRMKGDFREDEFIRGCEEVAMYQAAKRLSTFMPPSFKEWTSLQEL